MSRFLLAFMQHTFLHLLFFETTRWRRLLAVFLFFIQNQANAQDPNYITIDKSKGLPSNNVYNLIQDSKGFIWVATETGLSRYDGYQFKTYSNPTQTSKSGSEIHEDVYGRIWYENFDGYLYYVENDSLHALKQNKTGGYSPYGLSKKTLFHISEKGVDLYDLKTLALRKTIPLKNKQALVYAQGSGNLYYVGTKNDLLVFDDLGKTKHVSNQLEEGKMIAVSNGGLWFYNPSPPNVVRHFSEYNILPLFTNQNNTFVNSTSFSGDYVWFCSASGTYAYSITGSPLENGRTFFTGKSISCVFKDREANYWFCTTNEGILFVPDFASRRLVPEKNIRRLALYNDQLFFGTQRGEVWRLNDQKTQQIFKSGSGHSVDFLESGDAFAPLFITTDSFFVLKDNAILKQHSVSVKDCCPIAPGTYACALTGYAGLFFAKDSPDNVWKHLSWGRFDSVDHLKSALGYMLLESVRAKSVAWDAASQTIYYATNKGLFAATQQGLTELKDVEKSIYLSRIAFYGGVLYGLSTQGEILTFQNNKLTAVCNQKYGLRSSEVRSMKLCGHLLFFSTSSKICYLDLDAPSSSPVFFPVYASDINDIALWKNKIYLASPSGLLSFDLTSASTISEQPRFVLTGFFANKQLLSRSEKIRLTYNQNTIEIAYAILSFKTESGYPLYYRINDRDWEICSPKSRSLLLAALSPGDYVVRFRLGDASENKPVALQLNFTIEQAWWKKWWALLFYIVSFILILLLVYKRQIRIQARKNKLLTEKIELEKNLNRSILTSIKSQMNPHFFYNALNTIQSFIFENDKQNAGIYLSKFSKLTRMVLEMSEKENISLKEEITACTLYLELEQARFSEDFSFSVVVNGCLDTDLIRLPPMIIQPYIENAVKHGLLHKKGAKNLSVIFACATKNIVVTIEDNGIGRERSAQLNAIRQDKHKSFASEATKKRLELLNHERSHLLSVTYTDKHDESGLATGTLVHIYIPI